MISRDEYLDIYNVIGAAMKVHSILGRALEEAVYQEALGIELERRNIDAQSQYPIHCYYDGVKMKKFYIADFFYRGMIIELKSVSMICSEHRAQLFNYMRLTHTNRGILINFADCSLYAERYIYDEHSDDFVLITEDNYKSLVADK